MSPLFAVEKTLGRLAKWLRLMGFDTLFENDFEKGRFVDPIHSGRIWITRTQRRMRLKRSTQTIFIQDNDPMRQLIEVMRQTGITLEDLKPFSRCLRCNEPIHAVEREEIVRLVPDFIHENCDSFSRCAICGRVYWKGSHTEKSLERIRTIFREIQRAGGVGEK